VGYEVIRAAIISLVAAVAFMPLQADARIKRSQQARHEFVAQQECPATGRHRLPCPGWQIDHITPLCAGGPDTPDNMQWLTVQKHKWKTRTDVRVCRSLPK